MIDDPRDDFLLPGWRERLEAVEHLEAEPKLRNLLFEARNRATCRVLGLLRDKDLPAPLVIAAANAVANLTLAGSVESAAQTLHDLRSDLRELFPETFGTEITDG